MPENASRRGAVDLGMALMITAFAVIGGFMFWLTGQAALERELKIVEDTVTVEEDWSSVAAVDGVDIQMDASPYEGQEIRLVDFNVASLMGRQGFWLAMPNGNPFLVSMSAEVMAEGLSIGQGSTATVVGTVFAMNDSIVSAWAEAETIAENDRIVVEFATHFLEVTAMRVTGGATGGGDNEGAAN